jgi:hypothetical protein
MDSLEKALPNILPIPPPEVSIFMLSDIQLMAPPSVTTLSPLLRRSTTAG